MRKTLLFLIFSFLAWNAHAQEKIVRGKVVSSEDGSDLPGVSVFVKGTSLGTVTDKDGVYQIQVAAQQNILVFSFIGYVTLEATIDNREVVDVRLQTDIKQLSEVVVVGYGTNDKRLLTESIGVVKADAIKDLPVSTIDGILQGQTAGVQVLQNSGTPGGGMSVRIRGTTSISGSGQPLYVIDGIPVTTGDYAQVGYEGQGINALADLNPSEIESFSVLKDAAAAAIYGARASNGVILITTKRGKTGASTITFNTYHGVQQVWNTLDMLKTHDWMAYRNDLAGAEIYTEEDMTRDTTNTDWQDVIFRSAPISSYDLSMTGGDEKTRFFISGSYFSQDGIIIGSAFKRMNGRVNLDHKVNEKFNVGTSIGFTYSKTNRIESDASLHGPLPNGISTPSIYPVYDYDEDGKRTYNQSGPYSNPVSIANEATNENFTYRLISNVFGEYQIIPGLTVTSKWAIDFYNLREHAFEFNTVQGQKYEGLGFETYTNVLNLVSNNIIKYEKTFDQHTLDFLAGYSFEKKQVRDIYIRGQKFSSPDLEYLSSASTFVDPFASALDQGVRSFFGKGNYNFANKYLVGVSARLDASSNFGSNNKNGFFPSVSAGWRLSEESFLSSVKEISQLKLRASYGLLGNDNISAFQYAELYGTGTYNGQPAIFPNNMPNPDLKWETTAQFDIGIDAGFIGDRYTLTFDFYNKRTKDLLLSRSLPPTSGFTSIVENVGEMENKGIEITLGTQQDIGPVHWTSQLNISANRNKVIKLYNNQPIDDLGRGGNRVMEGQPIGIFYSFKSLGVDPSTGDIVYADKNEDGDITETDDRMIVGNPHPDFIGGFTNTLAYKGFDVSIFFQFSYGNDVFNGSRLFLESLQGGDNQLADVKRRWRQPGDITDIPRAAANAENKLVSSRFIEDGSYLRLKNLTIGYTVDRELTSRIHISSLRVYMSAQNLLTFTRYSGLDPEVNYSGNSTQVIGTDFFTFPQARAITVGLNLKF
jgi:TonB-dependent starch-binding outer membrane protein SusC